MQIVNPYMSRSGIEKQNSYDSIQVPSPMRSPDLNYYFVPVFFLAFGKYSPHIWLKSSHIFSSHLPHCWWKIPSDHRWLFCFQSPTSLPPASSRSMQWRLTPSSSASSSTPRTMMEALRNLITCQKVWWRFSVWKIRQSMQNNHCLFYFAVKAKNKSGLFHVRHM